jgi:hypothetical protein
MSDRSPAAQAKYIIEDSARHIRELMAHDRRFETLDDATMKILHRIAAGERIGAHQQRQALAAGEKIRHRLALQWLAIPYHKLCERLRAEGSGRTQRRPSGS